MGSGSYLSFSPGFEIGARFDTNLHHVILLSEGVFLRLHLFVSAQEFIFTAWIHITSIEII